MANPAMGNMRSLPLPKGFDGTRPEEWKDFVLKLKSFLNMQEHDYGETMDTTSVDPHAVTDARLVTRDENNALIVDIRRVRMSRYLKYLLILLCNGAPLTIIRSTATENGFEIWRQLCIRYAPDPIASHFGTLGHILEPVYQRPIFRTLSRTGRLRLLGTSARLVLHWRTQSRSRYFTIVPQERCNSIFVLMLDDFNDTLRYVLCYLIDYFRSLAAF